MRGKWARDAGFAGERLAVWDTDDYQRIKLVAVAARQFQRRGDVVWNDSSFHAFARYLFKHHDFKRLIRNPETGKREPAPLSIFEVKRLYAGVSKADARKRQSRETASIFERAWSGDIDGNWSIRDRFWFKKKAKRMLACGSRLTYADVLGPEGNPVESRLIHGQFCGDTFCGNCKKARATKHLQRVTAAKAILPEILAEERPETQKTAILLLTLTHENAPVTEAGPAVARLSRAWRNLAKTPEWKYIGALGYVRAIEVTDSANFTQVNQHIHAMIWVDEQQYFGMPARVERANGKTRVIKSRRSRFMNNMQWAELWQRASGIPYTPSIKVNRVGAGEEEQKAILETLKYATKGLLPDDSDEWDKADKKAAEKWLVELSKQLKNKHLVEFGGFIQKARKRAEEKGMLETWAEAAAKLELGGMIRFRVYSWWCDEHVYRRNEVAETIVQQAVYRLISPEGPRGPPSETGTEKQLDRFHRALENVLNGIGALKGMNHARRIEEKNTENS